MKWSEMHDDDLSPDDIARDLVASVEGDIKTTYRFETDANGQTVKVCTKHKVHRNVERVSRAAQRRKARMSDLNTHAEKPTYGEETHIEVAKHLRRLMDEDEDDADNDEPEKPSGAHLALFRKDGVRMKFNQLKRLEAGGPLTLDNEPDVDALVEGFGDTGPAGDRNNMRRRGIEDNTVRVTNLSEEVQEQDLKDLFGKFGEIRRVYLAVDKQTNSSKGFAFITFANRADGQAAISGLNRHGYDSLLMHVEWSKPKPQ